MNFTVVDHSGVECVIAEGGSQLRIAGSKTMLVVLWEPYLDLIN